jgi:hypothetical protein
MRIQSEMGIPTPVPTAGIPSDAKSPLAHKRFVVVWLLCSTPDFGRFYGSHGGMIVEAVLAKNLPHRSRENEFRTDRFYECQTPIGHHVV